MEGRTTDGGNLGISHSSGKRTVRCQRCGKPWPQGTEVCPDDGTRLYEMTTPQPSKAISQPPRNSITEINAPFAGSLTDLAPKSALNTSVADDAGTEINAPFNESLTDRASPDFLRLGSAALANPKLPQGAGSSAPTNELIQPFGSNVPTNARIPQRAATPAPIDDELVPGTRVGEYEIEGKIGEGAMGTVYRAVHPTIGKHVAVKIMNAKLCRDPGAIERFTREARSVAAIRHPGIVDVFGFGTLDDGRAYLIMDWLDGRSLGARLERGRLAFDEALDTVDQIARALEAAHDKGIIHRDLKPDNVFLEQVARERPIVRILDFGLAKLAHEEGRAAMTQTGQLLGTPIYMSPEQCRGKGVDHRTDIYALGCIAYELICGRVPFDADNIAELIAAQLSEQPPLPRLLWPEIPPQLDGLLFAMLAKDPARRPTLEQIRQAISTVAPASRLTPGPGQWPTPAPGQLTLAAPAAMAGAISAAAKPVARTTLGSSTGELRAQSSASRSRFVIVSVALAIAAIGILVTVMATRGRTDSDPVRVSDHEAVATVVAPVVPPQTSPTTSRPSSPSSPSTTTSNAAAPVETQPNVGVKPDPKSAREKSLEKTAREKPVEKTAKEKPVGAVLEKTLEKPVTGKPIATGSATVAPASETGTLTLTSTPTCEIYVDGASLNLRTPQRDIKLSGGRHSVTLINKEHGLKDSFVVEIKPGEVTRTTQDYSDRMAPTRAGSANGTQTINPFRDKKKKLP